MPSFSEVFGGGGIKSVQRGVTTPSSTTEVLVTIAPVNPAKTTVSLLSMTTAEQTSYNIFSRSSVRLVSGTQLGVTGFAGDASSMSPVSWEVVEWY